MCIFEAGVFCFGDLYLLFNLYKQFSDGIVGIMLCYHAMALVPSSIYIGVMVPYELYR